MAFSLGGAIAPVLGGFLNDKIGFRATSDVMAVAAFATFIFYLIVGICMHKEKSIETNFNEPPRDRRSSSYHASAAAMMKGGPLVPQ